MDLPIKIKDGYGYWETTRHPLGGEFHRATADGPVITEITLEYKTNPRGCTHEGRTEDGRTMGFNINHTEPVKTQEPFKSDTVINNTIIKF